jgi:D-aminoacyl-tRNA deacylase
MQLRSYQYCKKITLVVITQVFISYRNTIQLPTTTAMRVVVQRVKSASVSLVLENNKSEMISQIGSGLVALVGIHVDDTIEDVNYCCQRLINCKLWSNDNDKPWKYSVKQKQYECLLVSQFTLYGTLSKKSCQPDYKLAMKSESARELYEQFIQTMKTLYDSVPNKIQDGRFGAMMDVALINDGPVTIIIESRSGSNNNVNEDNDNPR